LAAPLPAVISFDIYGTLVDVRAGSRAAFDAILRACGAMHIDTGAFWEHWESANIRRYWEPYRDYKSICRDSLAETFRHFDVEGEAHLIRHYFQAFPKFPRFPDVDRVLTALQRRTRVAVVTNMDDDLLEQTHLGRTFDLVCTAERARGYKPDGSLFRYLLRQAGCGAESLLHCGQSQYTDMVGAKPLGIRVAWINSRDVPLASGVPKPDYEFPDLESVLRLLGD
jgi:2-haloacid dehalogenase